MSPTTETTDTRGPNEPSEPTDNLPQPIIKPPRRGRFSLVWLVPIVAILAGGALVVRQYLGNGPKIHITFDTADGLEGGKSEVRYRNVVVGKVTRIDLDKDRQHIIATVQLTHGASGLAVEDTKFWVERPRIGLSGVTGVGTLLTGAFINVDIGSSKEDARDFIGLEKPPGVLSNQHGRLFRLTAQDAGSLGIQSPIYFRRIEVGLVSSIELAKDGRQIEIDVFINSPYDRDVTEHTVFWNASGIDLAVNAEGLKLDTQSLATVLAGGIAFGVRQPIAPDPPAKEHQLFALYDDRITAMKSPDGPSFAARMRFRDSVRGLVFNTPIDFDGISVGTVTSVSLGFDAAKHEFYGDVTAEIFPERLDDAYKGMLAADPSHASSPVEVWQAVVAHGLRAQIRSASLITGTPYIAWDFFPRAAPVKIAPDPAVLIVPTERGAADQIQDRIEDVVSKVDAIPYAEIASDARDMIARADKLLGTLDTSALTIAPAAQHMFTDAAAAIASLRNDVMSPDAPLQSSARTTLDQIKRAAYSLRTLSDYLVQHPEALIRGRDEGKEPTK